MRTRIHAAEQDLEEELRQRLMETAIELAASQEKIAELNLAVRAGEMPYAEYRTQVDCLRRRRDNHERRQSKLARPWSQWMTHTARAARWMFPYASIIPKVRFALRSK